MIIEIYKLRLNSFSASKSRKKEPEKSIDQLPTPPSNTTPNNHISFLTIHGQIQTGSK